MVVFLLCVGESAWRVHGVCSAGMARQAWAMLLCEQKVSYNVRYCAAIPHHRRYERERIVRRGD